MASQILIVMIAAIAVAIWAEGRNIQAPLLLALVGLAASFLPFLPRLELEPEIILTVVLPPLLYSAASELSFDSFLKRLGSIVNLGVVLVLVTTTVVGAVAAAVIPGLPIAAATVLAAVVSPPDAVTATAVGRKLGLPGRMMTVLKGESLINDAAALTLFAFATATITGTHLLIENRFLYFGYAAVVGILVGVAIGMLVHRVRVRLTNASLSTVVSVLVPFAAYLIAEELGASGVLAVVAAGFANGHNASEANYEARIQERQFWRTADSLLEAFVFAYIGLQLRFVIQDAQEAGFDLIQLFLLSGIVLLAVILVRIAWVFGTALLFRWRRRRALEGLERRRAAPREPARTGRAGRRQRGGFDIPEPFSWKENLVIGWTGMRGVVTLAAAAGIPLTTLAGEAFPGRDAIQVVAFTVTIGTLLIQGLTLPWLIKALGINDPKEAKYREEQHRLAHRIADQAGREALARYRDEHADPAARSAADQMLRRSDFRDEAQRQSSAEHDRLVLELGRTFLDARRTALIKARDDRQLDDEVLREIMEDLDLQQAVLANWQPGRFSG
ncbi:cation:proton antiporter [Devosia sp. CN2-171]|uniref:cation:proton antiporter n=1 Tax=Devosia sp. CN2-171 TaxID=3400909 RepID=UPI003BF922B3